MAVAIIIIGIILFIYTCVEYDKENYDPAGNISAKAILAVIFGSILGVLLVII